jgi:hypothetical protein
MEDYRAQGRERQRVMILNTNEFIRRFLIHVLPHGFHRIRHYGLFANGSRAENIARVGLGMGLSIARTIVEAHGGRIWAENWIDGGAVSRLSLPSGIGSVPTHARTSTATIAAHGVKPE